MYGVDMKCLRETRIRRGLSQRRLASRAGVSFRAVQLIEAGKTDPRLSSLDRIATALGTPAGVLESELGRLLAENQDSVVSISRRILADGGASWKLWLFEFVDAFRRHPGADLVEAPPASGMNDRLRCLLAATVETVCAEAGLPAPWWCSGVAGLPVPWFVAGVENLKALALAESPVHFRRRNVFVLANFLARA